MWGFLNAVVERFPGAWKLRDGEGLAVGQTPSADLPLCDDRRRGEARRVEGAAGVADRYVRCEKSTANTYAWRELGFAALGGAYQPLDADLTVIAGLADPNADRILFWDDSAGAYAYLTPGAGLTVSGTTLTADHAMVLIDEEAFSAASSVSLNSVFSATYENYLIVLNVDSMSAVANILMRLRVASVDSSAASYHWAMWNVTSGAGSGASAGASQTSWALFAASVSATTNYAGSILVARPAIADTTTFAGTAAGQRNDNDVIYLGGFHAVATAYDGFTLLPASGTMTGTVRVYALRNTP